MATHEGLLRRLSSTIEPPSAGILIIGDEILKGHTQDSNSHFLLKRLWSLGVKVKAVSVVPDDIEEIASQVRDFSSRFNFVLTSGGIGPTHDDVTMAAIARAFNEPLVQNKCLTEVLVNLYNVHDASQLNKFVLKMALIPEASEVKRDLENPANAFPLISLQNVYIFPGVPKYLRSQFDQFSKVFSNEENMFYLQKFYLSVEESTIAEELQQVHDKYGNKVHLGSYPEVGHSKFKTKLTLESLKPKILEQASEYLKTLLPDNAVVSVEAFSSGTETSKGKVELYWCQLSTKCN